MNSRTFNLKRLFEQERRLVVPLFQRPYVWKREDQWEPLWNDIEAVANATVLEPPQQPVKAHFLSARVLTHVPTLTGQGHLDFSYAYPNRRTPPRRCPATFFPDASSHL